MDFMYKPFVSWKKETSKYSMRSGKNLAKYFFSYLDNYLQK